MKIKTVDPTTKEIVFKTVTDHWYSDVAVEDQRIISFANGQTILASNRHPIMTTDLLEVKPDDITNQLFFGESQDTTATVSYDMVDRRYIDITVADTHTFFAGNDPTKELILTHNSQGGVRGGCVQQDSIVEIISGFEFNGQKFNRDDILSIDGTTVYVSELLNKLAYMTNDEERSAYLQTLFKNNFTIKTTPDNDS